MPCHQQSVSGHEFTSSGLFSPWLQLSLISCINARIHQIIRESIAMKKFAISLFAFLAGTSFAIAADAGCDAFRWPVTREQALFPSASAAQSGAALTVGQAADFSLAAVDTIGFEVPPGRAPAAGTFGAMASVTVPAEGELQFSLSDEVWIDVVQDGRAVKSAGFSRAKTCPGIRKSVRFKLSAGPATVQLSGAKKADLKVAVLTPE
ncbi:hypothetical protein [Mesorhizobium sp. WSM4962]|uniref:hypothetical protein n=1 Tax=unclassified Mesorhizobium TaxID=325217 RepID=UPI0030153A22